MSHLSSWRSLVHGSPGEVRVTRALTIKPETLYTVEVALFMRSMLQLLDAAEAGGRLDILGCNVAQGDAGAQFISELESVYKFNVAASDDATAAIRRPQLCCGANDMDRENDMILETDGVDVTQVRTRRLWLARLPVRMTAAHGLCAGLFRRDNRAVERASRGVPSVRNGVLWQLHGHAERQCEPQGRH